MAGYPAILFVVVIFLAGYLVIRPARYLAGYPANESDYPVIQPDIRYNPSFWLYDLLSVGGNLHIKCVCNITCIISRQDVYVCID